MEMTREQAIAEHRKMWNWIADEIEKKKKVVNIYEKKSIYCTMEGFLFISADCFLCEYRENNRGSCRKTCPLIWPGSGICMNEEEKGLFETCTLSESWQEQAELARQIANLPERTDI